MSSSFKVYGDTSDEEGRGNEIKDVVEREQMRSGERQEAPLDHSVLNKNVNKDFHFTTRINSGSEGGRRRDKEVKYIRRFMINLLDS